MKVTAGGFLNAGYGEGAKQYSGTVVACRGGASGDIGIGNSISFSHALLNSVPLPITVERRESQRLMPSLPAASWLRPQAANP
jgi:hypothetical protein